MGAQAQGIAPQQGVVTPADRQRLRAKRVWDVADFATFTGYEGSAGRRRARRLLKRLDAKHAGKLLSVSDGENREYTFYVATLARLEPDLFEPVESLEFRVDALEERTDEIALHVRRVAGATGQNTRDIAKMRRGGRAA